jgi:hypothetical protein
MSVGLETPHRKKQAFYEMDHLSLGLGRILRTKDLSKGTWTSDLKGGT